MVDTQTLISFIFLLGYGLIIFEHSLNINKAATALVTGILCWGVYLHLGPDTPQVKFIHLTEHLSDISQVLFFLIGAMTIVEIISSHHGFNKVRDFITARSPRKLMWVLLWLGFWMSSILDNLTTILILISIVRQIIPDKNLRQLLTAGLVFAVNIGGAWTPIGDITTTMLWIAGRVNTLPLISDLLIPSLCSLTLFGWIFSFQFSKEPIEVSQPSNDPKPRGSNLILIAGILGLVAVPVLKIVFSLPPFMGMMASLAVLWIITDRIHKKYEEAKSLKVEHILTKIDISCVMFFLGILLAVDALESAGILVHLEQLTTEYFSNIYSFSIAIGILSSIVDNVPLVAGMIKMMDPAMYPPDGLFWHLIAYTAGVGGSILIIGSAPGVALMSIKDVSFFWYFKKVSWIALIAFLFGCGVVFLLN